MSFRVSGAFEAPGCIEGVGGDHVVTSRLLVNSWHRLAGTPPGLAPQLTEPRPRTARMTSWLLRATMTTPGRLDRADPARCQPGLTRSHADSVGPRQTQATAEEYEDDE